MRTIDLSVTSVRELNQVLHDPQALRERRQWTITHPKGAHNIAVGVSAEVDIQIHGHAGYYCAGMNKLATVIVPSILDPRP